MTAQPRGDEELLADLKRHEGSVMRNGRHVVYDDATGKPIEPGQVVQGNPTIGYGRLVTDGNGLSEQEAEALLREDVANVRRQLDDRIPWWRDLSDNRRRALVNMAFNMGIGSLMGFQNMLRAMREGDFVAAASEALDSKWARQVGGRAGEVAGLIQKG